MHDKTKSFKDYTQTESGFLCDSSGTGVYSSATARWWFDPFKIKNIARFGLIGTFKPAIIIIDGI